MKRQRPYNVDREGGRYFRKKSRSKTYVPRMRNLRSSVMYYKRKFYLENWQPNVTSTNGFWRQYNQSLSNLPNVSELTNLFEEYKINAIKLEFMPRFDSFAGNSTTDTTPPGVTNLAGTKAHICYENRTNVPPAGTYSAATMNNFLELGDIKSYDGLRPFSVYYKPSTLDSIGPAYGTGKFRRSSWLPTYDTTVTHFGPHIFLADNNFAGNFGNNFDIFVTLYIMLRNTK